MNNFGVRHYKVTKVKLITIIMNIIKNTINNLQNLYNEKDEYFSFIYKDIYTGYTVSYNADSPIFTASSIKAPCYDLFI